MSRRWLRLVSTSNPMVSGRSFTLAKYLMDCGRPSSARVKSSLVRSRTISPLWVRTVAGTFTTFTFDEYVGSCCAPAGPSGKHREMTASTAHNFRRREAENSCCARETTARAGGAGPLLVINTGSGEKLVEG